MSLFILSLWSYIGKSIVISGILYAYYRVFLRNGVFHSYNRWYLLGSGGLALVLPWVRLPFSSQLPGETVFAILQPTGSGGGPVVLPAGHPVGIGGWWSGSWGVDALYVGYGIGMAVFVFFLLRSLHYLWKLSRRYPYTLREGIRFFETGEPGTPFSFMNRLFWNRELAVDSETGRSIFRHEIYHIRQRHSLDLLVLEILRCLFWINPFFHLILRELKVVHEFLADRYALAGEGGPEAGLSGNGASETANSREQYAEFLVWLSVRGVHTPALVHPFFHTTLKRRITMILQTTPMRPHLISRWMALPLLLALVAVTAGTSAEPGKTPSPKALTISKRDPLLVYYMKHLHYPANALQAGQEATVVFTIRVGANHRLLAFEEPGAAAAGPDVKEVVVSARPAEGKKLSLTGDQAKAVFREELNRVSEHLSRPDTAAYIATIQPGTYYIRVVFKIEKSGTAAATVREFRIGQPGTGRSRTEKMLIAYAKNPGLEKYLKEKIWKKEMIVDKVQEPD